MPTTDPTSSPHRSVSAVSSSPPIPPLILATISRRESFSSAHRLHSPLLSDEENVSVYGKCNNVNCHGHNYTLQVDVRGPIDPRTGMVVSLANLKSCISDCVISVLDHRNLDLDVPYFANGIPSTTENLAVFVYRTLDKSLPLYVGPTGDGVSHPRLAKVTIWETDKNLVEYWEYPQSSLDGC